MNMLTDARIEQVRNAYSIGVDIKKTFTLSRIGTLLFML